MDFDEILSRFGALPGQLPDEANDEPSCHLLVRSQCLENPKLLELYHLQGLPVELCVSPQVFILEPEPCLSTHVCHAVLFESGLFSEPGLWLQQIHRTITVAWNLDAACSPVHLNIFELQPSGVTTLRYRLAEKSGRVCFIARPEIFAVRSQFHVVSEGKEHIVFGERLFLV